MKNLYPAKCYCCGQPVGPGDGEVVKYGHAWRVRHHACKPMKMETKINANP